MDGNGSIARVYTALFVFCGVGGGAIGFQRARVQLRGFGASASFRILGGIEYDPGTAQDFTRLTGAPCLARKVEELTPADLIAFCGGIVPDVVFFSPPCKASSGLLSPELAATEKYQEMAQLALVWIRLMLATWGSRVRMVLMENVPRVRTRHAPMMAEARRLLEGAGYILHDEAHNLGEIGGLAQNRDRLLLAARHKSVTQFLYKPVKRRVRGVGEVLEKLPLPGDPAAGPLHALPELDPITAIRLALIPAGGDWHDLPERVVLPPELAENLGGKSGRKVKPSDRTPFNDVYRVVRWDDPAGAVTCGDTPSAGVVSVADPRCTGTGTSAFANNYTVTGWSEPSGTVIGKTQLGSGAGSVADPRTVVPSHPHTYGVLPWNGPAHTVTGNVAPGGGPHSVADPRPSTWFEQAWGVVPWDRAIGTVSTREHPSNGEFSVADPRAPQAFNGSLGVGGWDAPSDTVTSREGPTNGRFSVADPRVTCKTFENSRIYGIVRWDDPAYTVTAHACHDNGPHSVADPRNPRRVPFPVIISLDGTWHRPLTILERAVLQGFDPVLDGKPLTLTGRSKSAWSVRIGDAVPPPAAEAMAEQFLLTLLYADSGVFALSSGGGVWVRERAELLGVELGEGVVIQ